MVDHPILIVDDEPDLIELVSYNLTQAGFRVIAAADGATALESARSSRPQLIILDLMLPHMDGLEVCRRLRSDPVLCNVPIIMLTARNAEADRVVGLELGADDYVPKPFSARELLARVRAVLRRTAESAEYRPIIEHGLLRIDKGKFEATYDKKVMPLTAAEMNVLRFLAERPERAFDRQAIINGALGSNVVVTDRNIDVHIAAIRKKLGSGHNHIQTVRGVGYRFARDPHSAQ